MSAPGPRVPLALRLAALLLPAQVREEVLGDLLEHWSDQIRGQPLPARLAWAWRQPLSAIGTRLRFRTRAGSGVGLRRRVPVAAAGHGRAGISWIDVKLGLRMLIKYPVLTLVAGFTLAIGIPVGMYPLHMLSALEATLPFEDSERIVVLRYVEENSFRRQQVPFRDFAHWRENLTGFQAIGATTMGMSYNVISEDGAAAPVRGAEVTASLFDILRVGPLLGRTLVPADEVAGAADVVVIGHNLWESRLGADLDVVGRDIRIGGVPHTVVGVMPEGFLFPVRDHLWMPLRVSELDERAEATEPPRVFFGRLADGVSREEAHAELSAVGAPAGAEPLALGERLRAEVVSFPIGLMNVKNSLRADPEMYWLQAIALLVLVVACANVGMLIFARTTTRSTELAVRTALGASRTRVVSQLFTESLVLATLAAGTALLVADRIVSPYAEQVLPPDFPYWIDFGVTPGTVLWALSLAMLSAAVAGMVPALKATGKAVQRNIQRAAAGRSGIRFGGGSSALIVADVALAVVAVAFSVAYSNGFPGLEDDGTGQVSEFLSAELTIPRAVGVKTAPLDSAEYLARVAEAQQELVRRLSAEPGVRGVGMTDVLPGMDHRMRWIEVDGDVAEDARGYRVGTAHVAPGFFEALQHPIESGRAFDLTDLGEGGTAVIVNTDFVDQVLAGRNPIGRRVRYAARADELPGPWYEIVGVVGRLGTVGMNSEPLRYQALYHPLATGALPSVRLAVHVGSDAESFTPRLRALAGEVDPAAIVSDPLPLDEVLSYTRLGHMIVIAGAGILVGILIALAASGIYALMSFTVTERTREIGIRTALGADRARVVSAVARRAVTQLGVGALLGMAVAAWLLWLWEIGEIRTGSPFVLTLALGTAAIFLIGLLACAAPTLRALRIEPTKALREGG